MNVFWGIRIGFKFPFPFTHELILSETCLFDIIASNPSLLNKIFMNEGNKTNAVPSNPNTAPIIKIGIVIKKIILQKRYDKYLQPSFLQET